MFRSGSRSRELHRRAATGAVKREISTPDVKPVGRCSITADRVSGEGNPQFKRRTYPMKIPVDPSSGSVFQIEENSFSHEFSQGLPKKPGGTPIKALIAEEMSKESEFRRPSPSIVARLMGLDNLPPRVLHKPHGGEGLCSPKGSFLRCQDKYVCSEGHLLQASKDECQDFKGAFEIVKRSKSKKHKELQKGLSRSKRSDADMAFIRKKFMEAKHLSSNETLRHSKEFDDALEALDSKKDLFLEFLQDPNSLFSKHLQDLKCASSPPHASHITILKSSRSTKQGNDKVYYRSKRTSGSCAYATQEVIASPKKPASGIVSHSLEEYNTPLARNMFESDYMVKGDACTHATRIVVLKPSLDKVHRTARSVILPRSPDDYQFDNKSYRETQKAGVQEFFLEGSTLRKSADSAENMGHRTKGSRQIAREITETMRNRINDGCRKAAGSRLNQIKRGESTRTISVVDSEALQWTSDRFNSLNDSSSSSSPYSTETSVSREARKCLSDRWKMAKQPKEAGLLDQPSGTLREILALPDKEVCSAPITSCITRNDETLDMDEVTTRRVFGIRNRDGWKERYSRNSRRPNSLPASSSGYRNSKPSAKCKAGGDSKCYMLKDVLNLKSDDSLVEIINLRERSSWRSFKQQRRKGPPLDSSDEENMLPEQEIHVNMEGSITNSDVNHQSFENMMHENSDDSVPHRGEPDDDFLVSKTKLSSITSNNELIKEPIPCILIEKDQDISGYHQNDFMMQEKSNCQMGTLSPHDHITELGSPSSFKEAEQPSPMSVLELAFEEDTSSTGCFERVSADLKELRMQLQLLKSESLGRSAEESEVILSDYDAGGCCPIMETVEVLHASKDEASRDFSYIIDVLNMNFNGADWATLSHACFNAEYPVWPSVFDNLEKKYSNVESWLKSERKQLFDLTNSVLAEIIASRKTMHPWVNQWSLSWPVSTFGDLAEKVWQMVSRNRKGTSVKLEQFLEPKWLDLAADVDMIELELEATIKEDLLEELVSEFMLTRYW